ncbi:hypothetical protein CBR_g8990 [Chara braunii]|uniref:Uncharacterized protein n=1 Tax=Chara braunii TaxID=69332 RepID=A0A388KNE9_CHABU|nr:hypothetical protein CBR_g8990 [Chara braunii]|eukprot:GBG71574.1 hypothetical protein CBR_g8990 [Chara braunii]
MERWRYHCGLLTTGLARVLNLLVVAGGAAAIVMVFVLEHKPRSAVAFGFIGLGIVAIISGITGVCAASRTSCFICHLLLALLSAAGLATSALCIFLRMDEVTTRVHSRKMSGENVKDILRIEGGVFAGMLVLVVTGIALSIIINCCDLLNYKYEDLEMGDRRRADMQKIRQDAKRSVARAAPVKSAALAEKMREKYGKFVTADEFSSK